MKHLIIIGVGGFARECCWHAQNAIGYGEEFDIKGYIDGDVKLADEEYKKLQYPLLGDVFNYQIESDDIFTCAIGSSKVRKKLINIIESRGGGTKFHQLIHKSASILPGSKLGRGVIICERVGVGEHVQIGDFSILNSNTSTGHDAVVGSYCDIMGSVEITGNVHIGDFTYIGTGAIFIPHAKVGEHAFIGAGSVVLKKVKANTKVFGNPALEI